FGRVIGVDFGLVVPDETKTLREGAVRPWQSPSFKECQDDLEKYAKKRKIPLDTPFRELSAKEKHWVLEGEPEWVSWRKSWPGTARRGRRSAAHRGAHAARLSLPGRARLSHARSTVAHAVRWRGPAHQSDNSAGHIAGEYAVCARRAVHRPASARHGPRDRRH